MDAEDTSSSGISLQQSEQPSKPYHAKRPHKKSRKGCRSCKARKVKCDEARPACKTCILRKTKCEYPEATGPSGRQQQQQQQQQHAPSSRGSASPAPSEGTTRSEAQLSGTMSPSPAGNLSLVLAEPRPMIPGRDLSEMRLIWFYTAKTFSSFSIRPDSDHFVNDILKVRIVQHAFESPFLMDCLLGLASMHMKSLDQAVDSNMSLVYKARAFGGYRKAIEDPKPEDYPALLCCSLLFTALSTPMFREESEGRQRLAIVDWMVIWRGIGLLIDIVTPEVMFESGLAPLFFRPPLDLDKASAHIPNHLLLMVTTIKESDVDFPHVKTYYYALKYLGSLYQELQEGFTPFLYLRIITWFTFLPRPFVDLVRDERPRALVIVAHWLPFAKFAEVLWYMKAVGEQSIVDISDRLGEQWHPYLRVPRSVLGISYEEEAITLARLILENPKWIPKAVGTPRWDDSVLREVGWVNDEGKKVERFIGLWWNLADTGHQPRGSPDELSTEQIPRRPKSPKG